MQNRLAIICVVMIVAAMGSTGNQTPPSRVNPPSSAEVDAAQSAGPAHAESREKQPLHILEADKVTPGEFQWQARPVVVFADTAADPAFIKQIADLRSRPGPLADRDVVVITDVDPAAQSIWRQEFRPRGFSLLIIDKDGQVKQRKPRPWSVREITHAIDKFPLRREEREEAGRTVTQP